MKWLEKSAQKTNLWTSIAEKFWALIDAIGLKPYIVAMVFAATTSLWGVLLWIFDKLPFWAIFVISIFLSILTLNFFIAIRRAWAISGIKKIDISEIGKECKKFREDVLDFFVSRLDAAPGRSAEMKLRNAGENSAEIMHEAWALGADYSNQTRARSMQKFAHRAIAMCHLIETAGIKAPDLWGLDHNLPGIAAYIGAVGELLERGLLNEARRLDPQAVRRAHVYMG